METNTITRIATVANKRGSVRIANNSNDVKCLVIDGFAPDDKVCFVPVSIVLGRLLTDVKSNLLLISISKELAKNAGKGINANDCREQAIRALLSKLRIKGDFNHHTAGEVFTKEDGTESAYTTDWDELDADTVKFSYGELKSAYESTDAKAFVAGSNDVVEDF